MLMCTRKLVESELRKSYDRNSQFWGVWTHGSIGDGGGMHICTTEVSPV